MAEIRIQGRLVFDPEPMGKNGKVLKCKVAENSKYYDPVKKERIEATTFWEVKDILGPKEAGLSRYSKGQIVIITGYLETQGPDGAVRIYNGKGYLSVLLTSIRGKDEPEELPHQPAAPGGAAYDEIPF